MLQQRILKVTVQTVSMVNQGSIVLLIVKPCTGRPQQSFKGIVTLVLACFNCHSVCVDTHLSPDGTRLKQNAQAWLLSVVVFYPNLFMNCAL